MKKQNKKLISLIAGVNLFAGVSMAQNYSEKCIVPQRFLTPDYISDPTLENVIVKGVKYHAHVYSIDGDMMADIGVFFELDDFGKPLNHPEKPKFYAYDFDGTNSFSPDELCEKKIDSEGKVEWYKFKDFPKPKLNKRRVT